jgi:O-antigen/teichoic acid export membrane protein
LKHTAILVVPAVVAVFVSAPWILSIFGRDYADDGTKVLRLLALSAIPDIVTAIYVGVARAQRRVVAATVVLGSIFVLVTGLCIPLLQVAGVNGAGWAWLIAQMVVATAVYRFGLRPLLDSRTVARRPTVPCTSSSTRSPAGSPIEPFTSPGPTATSHPAACP